MVEARTEQRCLQYSRFSITSAPLSTQAGAHDLYWSVGDSGPQEDPDNHGQNPKDLHGTIVRIQVPTKGAGYDIPAGNYEGGASFCVCVSAVVDAVRSSTLFSRKIYAGCR